MAELRTRAPQIARTQTSEAEFGSVLLHHMPDHSLRYPSTFRLRRRTEIVSRYLIRPHESTRLASFSPTPALVRLLQMRKIQISQLARRSPQPSKTARIARSRLPFNVFGSGALPLAANFLSREPVSKPHAQLLDASHASDTRGKFGTEQASVSGLISQPKHRGKSPVDRSRRESAILEKNPVTGDDNFVKRQARLGAIAHQKIAIMIVLRLATVSLITRAGANRPNSCGARRAIANRNATHPDRRATGRPTHQARAVDPFGTFLPRCMAS
jgi:hypothetical protein